MEPLYLTLEERNYIEHDRRSNYEKHRAILEHEADGGSLSDFYHWAKNGLLNKPTSSFKRWLGAHGNEPITSLEVVRAPLKSAVEFVINLATVGKLKQNKKKFNYPDVYHLFFVINGKWHVEKNHVVEAYAFKPKGDLEVQRVNINKNIKICELLNPHGDSFWTYSANHYNCQDFVIRCLKNNDLLTKIVNKFAYQDPLLLLEGLNHSNLNVFTDAAALAAHYAPGPLKRVFGGNPLLVKHPGSLSKFGYVNVSKLSPEDRRSALMKAYEIYGKRELELKLTAIFVLNKHRSVGQIFKKDLEFVKTLDN